MALQTDYEFLFVGRDEGSFLENYAYDVREQKGDESHVFLCLEIQNNPAEAAQIGEAVFEALKEAFFRDTGSREPYARFEQALKAMNQRLSDFRRGKLNKYIGVVHAIVGAVEQETLYVSQCGESEAYLIRKRFVSVVSEGLFDPHHPDGDLFTSIASGDIEPGDFVLFATTRLLRYVTKMDLSRMVSPVHIERTLADLRDALSGEILGRIGLVGIGVTLAVEPAMGGEDVGRGSGRDANGRKGGEFFGHNMGERLRAATSFGPLVARAKRLHEKVAARVRDTQLFSRTGSVGRWASDVSDRLRTERGLTKDKVLILFVAVILLLAAGITYVRYHQAQNAQMMAYDQRLNEARQMISDAESKGQLDKKAAGVIFDAAEAKAREVLNSSYLRAKASEVLGAIQKSRDTMDNIRRIDAPQAVADVSSRGASNLVGFVQGKDRYYAYDGAKMYEIILDKISEPLSFDANDPVISGSYFDEKDEPIFFTKSGKVVELVHGALRPMSAQEGAFHKGVQMLDWGSRLYILDPASDQIWRYPYVKSKDSFGASEGYKTQGDLKNGVAFTIDSNVYVLQKDGAVMKFYGGVKQNFSVERAPFSVPTGPIRIVTDAEMNTVYILDAGQNKVYMYAKDPKTQNFVYLQQLLISGTGDLRDVAYDKSASKLYVLDAKKMYQVPLQ